MTSGSGTGGSYRVHIRNLGLITSSTFDFIPFRKHREYNFYRRTYESIMQALSRKTWVALLLCLSTFVVLVGGSEDDSWIEGTLFFHAPDNNGIVDEAIRSGAYLSREDLTSLGLEDSEVDAVTQVVRDLGGQPERLSGTRDWMHVRFPSSSQHMGPSVSAISNSFVRKSKEAVDNKLHSLVQAVAEALHGRNLEHLVSHMILKLPQEEESMQKYRTLKRRARQLSQASNTEDSEGPSIAVIPAGRADSFPYPLFYDSASDALKNITCSNGLAVMVRCQGEEELYFLGSNTEDCLLGISLSFQRRGDLEESLTTQEFSFKELIKHRKTCADVPQFCDFVSSQEGAPIPVTSYVYGLPSCKYTIPGVVYDTTVLATLNSTEGPTVSMAFENGYIMNQFPASPLSLREFYGVDPTFQGSAETVQASTIPLGAWAVNETAINEYLSLLGLDPHRRLQFSDFPGGDANNATLCLENDCNEPMLDVQTQQSFAPNATTYFTPGTVGVTVSDEAKFYLNFFDDILMADPKIQVASLSATFDAVGPNLTMATLEESLKRLASSGISILVASGDAGASGVHAPESQCLPGTDPLMANKISESWPASSPWVTSVGATQILATGEDMKMTEVACSSATGGGITSGGGFSGTWLNVTTPAWQKPFVEQYLSKNEGRSGFPTKDTPGYNPNGRGYPDIALYGASFPILTSSGDIFITAGTSLSAPMAASLFTLANEQLLNNGYDVIGYANPMLYWMADNCPEAFTDITIGNNQPGAQVDTPCLYGFNAAPGWDPVTGLGSINLQPFIKCAMRWQDQRKDARTSSVTSGVSHLLSLSCITGYLITVLVQYMCDF